MNDESDKGWVFKPIDKPLCERKEFRAGNETEAGSEGQESKESEETAKSSSVRFVSREPIYSFTNLVLPVETARQLQTLKARFECHSLVYDDWGLSETDPCGKHIAFNLYGPPGTGKTMCVEAVAGLFHKRIIDVSYAEIESKYVGDTGKNITAAFSAAKDQDALLFFDEADSILGQRMTSVTQAADQAVNVARAVMLKQLDAFDGIVAFATNLAKNFDNAFVRRISVHIEIPLPDRDGRRQIAERLIPIRVPFRHLVDFNRLADETGGMSGGDLKNVVVNAICALAATDWRTCDSERVTEEFLRQTAWSRRAKKNVGQGQVAQTVEELDVKGVADVG